MSWYWLFGKKHCSICGTPLKRNGDCSTPAQHAMRIVKSQAAKGKAGRRRGPLLPRYCLTCGKKMIRFQGEISYRWKCPDPRHPARIAAAKRRRNRRKRKKR